jgi:hypothetical protein
MDEHRQRTYDLIVDRCKSQHPSIDIRQHIKPGTLIVHNNTLDGIEFRTEDPENLKAEFGGRMKMPGMSGVRMPRPPDATLTSMKEEPGHWALQASMGATDGEGFREQWMGYVTPAPASLGFDRESVEGINRLSTAFGEAGKLLKYTALHASVSGYVCKIHIDERGFVLKTPQGVVVGPSFWSHLANELLFKTEFRNWLDGLLPDNRVGNFVVEVVNRTSLRFSDAENGFAGLKERVDRIKGPKDIRGIGQTLLPIGVSVDVARFRQSTAQFNYFSYGGQKTLTITLGGTF